MPEALETWGLPLFRSLLPRPLEIIFEINRRFLEEVRQRYPGDEARVGRMSLIDESGERRIRMANLAMVGSHAINGVAALHSRLLKQTVLRDFAEMWPERFHNVTNGVTPRRFVALRNPGSRSCWTRPSAMAGSRIWRDVRGLERHVDDAAFKEQWRRIKRANKEALARCIRSRTGVVVDPDALFDIQVKRIHEYKRQHLNALHIITLYQRLRRNPRLDIAPRCFVFGGKAAPGYHMAKLMIRLINGVAEVVNADPAIRERLEVVFFPDFNVKNAHPIYPAADLSEQISTAGKEASGTGNMKFMMNGALTIGTLDGANVEMREEVGEENFFLFGLNAEEVERLKREGYRPAEHVERNDELREALELVARGHFSRGDREMFRPLLDNLLQYDPFLVLADYADYARCQEQVGAAWRDPERWSRMSILNTARSGKFSSDRSIREYCERDLEHRSREDRPWLNAARCAAIVADPDHVFHREPPSFRVASTSASSAAMPPLSNCFSTPPLIALSPFRSSCSIPSTIARSSSGTFSSRVCPWAPATPGAPTGRRTPRKPAGRFFHTGICSIPMRAP